MVTDEEIKNRVIKLISDLTGIIAKRDKKVKTLEKRIEYLESEEYGKPLIDMGIDEK